MNDKAGIAGWIPLIVRGPMTEREALKKLKYMLIYGQIEHHAWGKGYHHGPRFNMTESYHKHSCGTIACIGGYVAQLMDEPNPVGYVRSNRFTDLKELYYPSIPHELWNNITPMMAAKAIDNYLKDGDPRWSEIMGVSS